MNIKWFQLILTDCLCVCSWRKKIEIALKKREHWNTARRNERIAPSVCKKRTFCLINDIY